MTEGSDERSGEFDARRYGLTDDELRSRAPAFSRLLQREAPPSRWRDGEHVRLVGKTVGRGQRLGGGLAALRVRSHWPGEWEAVRVYLDGALAHRLPRSGARLLIEGKVDLTWEDPPQRILWAKRIEPLGDGT